MTAQAPKASNTRHHPALPAATADASRHADRLASPVKKTRTSTVRALAIIAICAGAAAAVYAQRSAIGEGFHNIGHLNWA